jgi:hypothetical protein
VFREKRQQRMARRRKNGWETVCHF